jgi:hypothetical protein
MGRRPSYARHAPKQEVSMPPVTVLEVEVERRNWSREDLRERLLRTGRAMAEHGFSVSIRQIDRWLSGTAGTPRPAACRVLERLFNRPVAVLLRAPEEPAISTPPASPPPDAITVDRLTAYAALRARSHAGALAVAAVDPVSIETLHLEVRRLARGYATTPPMDLLADLVSARDRAYALIEHTRRPADLADLYLLAGQTCGLAATRHGTSATRKPPTTSPPPPGPTRRCAATTACGPGSAQCRRPSRSGPRVQEKGWSSRATG